MNKMVNKLYKNIICNFKYLGILNNIYDYIYILYINKYILIIIEINFACYKRL